MPTAVSVGPLEDLAPGTARKVEVDGRPGMSGLAERGVGVRSMGRGAEDDPAFFLAAGAHVTSCQHVHRIERPGVVRAVDLTAQWHHFLEQRDRFFCASDACVTSPKPVDGIERPAVVRPI